MIPILYEAGTITYTNNGLGRLTDCLSCLVTEERNGVFEVELTYPVTGIHYTDILEGRVVCVTHDEQKDIQPFIIYRITKPISGVVTVNAHHISYLLNGVVVTPFTAVSVADAFNQISTQSMVVNPFTYWTDNATGGSLSVGVPTVARSVLGGVRGSILDVFGGEYEWDGLTVKNHASRGADNGVTIRYRKNLTDIKQEVSTLNSYNAVVPYWADTNGTVVYGSVISQAGATDISARTLDLSKDFQSAPTAADLNDAATAYLASNTPWTASENIKIDFVALWQTEEYANIAPLERVQLCDVVTVIHEDLGIEATAKVIEVVWDALLDRYDSMELGNARSTFADTLLKDVNTSIDDAVQDLPTTSSMEAAIQNATQLITGGMGGHIVFLYDANGKPTDMLVMDTEDTTTAVNVLRINVNGIGFSSTGVSGPYTSAWTLDGAFVADFITAGTMSANRIQGGTLTLGGANNGNGVLEVYDSSGNRTGRWDNGALYLGNIASNLTAPKMKVDTNGALTTKSLTADDYFYLNGSNGSYLKIPLSTNYSTDSLVIEHNVDDTMLIKKHQSSSQVLVLSASASNGWYCYRDGSTSSSWMNAVGVVARSGSNETTMQGSELYCSASNVIKARFSNTQIYTPGTISCGGTKSRIVETDGYSSRMLYCYETPSPTFGDIGEGVIAEDGRCYVYIDSIFAETVETNQYQVFIQKYGDGDCWVAERTGSCFVVEGTPGISFGWELKGKQRDYDQLRLDIHYTRDEAEETINYADEASAHISELRNGRLSA